MEPYHYFSGNVPVVVSIPHAGTHVPGAILERFAAPAKQLPDTDWHVEKLYGFARGLGVHVLAATHSRYVVDLNRAPGGESLYPGRFTTGLCPLTLFDGSHLYRQGGEPDAAEVQSRIASYWQPYHDKLQSLLAALGQGGRKVVLFDAHSIRSEVPALFDGVLPDLNFGTADGDSADAMLTEKLMAHCRESPYSSVLNGRFKGGYITRHYGKPGQHVHAVQLELAQHNYMRESAPYDYDKDKASRLQATLSELLSIVVEWARS